MRSQVLVLAKDGSCRLAAGGWRPPVDGQQGYDRLAFSPVDRLKEAHGTFPGQIIAGGVTGKVVPMKIPNLDAGVPTKMSWGS
jgi:hypothetical protein